MQAQELFESLFRQAVEVCPDMSESEVEKTREDIMKQIYMMQGNCVKV